MSKIIARGIVMKAILQAFEAGVPLLIEATSYPDREPRRITRIEQEGDYWLIFDGQDLDPMSGRPPTIVEGSGSSGPPWLFAHHTIRPIE